MRSSLKNLDCLVVLYYIIKQLVYVVQKISNRSAGSFFMQILELFSIKWNNEIKGFHLTYYESNY